MATNGFIPKLWAEQFLEHLEKRLVAKAFVNTDYEGDIQRMGDTVVVNQIGDITISDYDPDVGLSDPEDLTFDDQSLVIDKAKAFNFFVDDIERVQASGDIYTAGTEQAARNMADAVDKSIFATIDASADSGNVLGSTANPLEITAENAYDYIVELRTLLAEADVPGDTRIAVPPRFYGLLLKDDRFVKAGTQQGEERLATGFIGKVDGFEVYESRNLPVTNVAASGNDPAYKVGTVIASYPGATSFAEQIVKTEAIKTPAKFGDIVRGLNVYGVKTFRPNCVAVLKFKI